MWRRRGTCGELGLQGKPPWRAANAVSRSFCVYLRRARGVSRRLLKTQERRGAQFARIGGWARRRRVKQSERQIRAREGGTTPAPTPPPGASPFRRSQ